ncbi:protein associated with UVRAG as autophagy enhancer [Nannospalax galili]|uniref:protein associated with UVRAG as autophagy enhancer n=1 Tax=Nannospalax galili TaxID=1026970 RepID=UPI0004ED2308|nr:protein associated with UVRAG as autophagy enhancer [Nannospalax galili]XP_017651414.1 protein associated with UVRAG as autophagy enhancer [Nannospalax galili]XP_017651415.1 protein associated with UVRAG as autophagy enhancer [Nannospalax galili]XP_029415130.1 protein associated with UVRAG as autophagy enhancer [Nannospalax galili]XP_029415131.1 protein associated with UVRAG as autophagy enhancer [Nannospalax galili]
MVSQFTGRRDSPVDNCEGISHDLGDIDGLPSLLDTDHPLYQLDVRFSRHKAAWINPLCAQQQSLQDLSPSRPTVKNSREHFVEDTPFPLGLSSWTCGDSLAEMPLSENTANSSSTSAHGSGEKRSDFSLTAEEQKVLRRGSQHTSLLKNPKTVATSSSPKVDGACFESFYWTASANEGAVQSSRGSHSVNFFSPETFTLPVDVEKENVHFYAADMVISMMEKIKCNLLSHQQPESWSLEEATGSLGNDQTNADETFYTPAKQELGSSSSSDSGYEGCAVLQVGPVTEVLSHAPVVKETCKSDMDELVILELGESNDITEACRSSCSSKSVTYESDFSSAELLARELFQVFWKCWMLSEPNHQLPGCLTAASSVGVSEEHAREDCDFREDVTQEMTLKSSIPGAEDWVPPGFQIILNIHSPLKRDMAVVTQNFFCAGCGTPIEPKLVKRLRYCEYLGKYFCDCCHSYAESYIPARILMTWDFRKYHVSNFSKWLIDSIWHQPIFNLLSLSHSLYVKAKELNRVKDMQEQLFHIKKLLKTCRFAKRALKAFEQVPSHLTDECHLFSLDDFLRTKKGLLAPLLKDILKASLGHVASCELCQGKGFICEFCQSTTVIFPFQTMTCRRCSACSACFHRQCFQSSGCPRCARITARRRLLESLPSATT